LTKYAVDVLGAVAAGVASGADASAEQTRPRRRVERTVIFKIVAPDIRGSPFA
jgi:hypothetical protein